ncbi:peptidoglycan-N-acetylmuramic acid deacetylase [Sedimentibacter acidaminivorans]|uniref:Peptidoglycan-N-acetylmuramic acid deacetylase n=1 Tax=Sedimentibacter acidaminivorans TaxID=913099 RepID=A0ABS4GBU4_9FIRM|nr:peptidoglycan-N-acetylmuramic acid deacetylase [Sedimentibacter acidaminivorans]
MIVSIKWKNIKIVIGCFILLFAAAFALDKFYTNISISASTEITNWGLSFQDKGRCPIGNATPNHLRKFNSYYIGDSDEKAIYLTFDAGFENGYTPSILDTLKKHNIKAAFFLVGNYIEKEPDLVKRMVEEGHIVGNHTYNHPDMSKISDMASFKKEINALEELYKSTTGQEMLKFYRPPQGKFNENNLKLANELGYKTIFWSLAYVDWYVNKQPTKEYAFEKLVPRIHPGAVVLLHSTSKTNCEILDELLTKWESEGYEFKTLNDLVNNN